MNFSMFRTLFVRTYVRLGNLKKYNLGFKEVFKK